MATSTPSGWKNKTVKIDEGYSIDSNNIGNIAKFGSIIFSPSYWIALHDHPRDPNSYGVKFPKDKNLPGPYSMNEGNIGNIQQFDSIIFSPPFADSKHHYKHGLKVLGENFKGRKLWEERQEIETSLENIGNIAQFGSIVLHWVKRTKAQE